MLLYIELLLYCFLSSVWSLTDSSASAFHEQGLQVAHVTTGVSISLLFSIYVLSVAMIKYSHQQATICSAYNFKLQPIIEGEIRKEFKAASHIITRVKSRERGIKTACLLSSDFLQTYVVKESLLRKWCPPQCAESSCINYQHSRPQTCPQAKLIETNFSVEPLFSGDSNLWQFDG